MDEPRIEEAEEAAELLRAYLRAERYRTPERPELVDVGLPERPELYSWREVGERALELLRELRRGFDSLEEAAEPVLEAEAGELEAGELEAEAERLERHRAEVDAEAGATDPDEAERRAWAERPAIVATSDGLVFGDGEAGRWVRVDEAGEAERAAVLSVAEAVQALAARVGRLERIAEDERTGRGER